jgi:hypothetical protein
MGKTSGLSVKGFMVRHKEARGLDGRTIRLLQEHADARVVAFLVAGVAGEPKKSKVSGLENSTLVLGIEWAIVFMDGEGVFGVISGFQRAPQDALQMIESWKSVTWMEKDIVGRLRFSWVL